MRLVKVTHPHLEGVHEVPERALGHWTRVGWEPVTEPETAAPPPAPTPDPSEAPQQGPAEPKTAARRRRAEKESE